MRESCARVAARARNVRIDERGLQRWIDEEAAADAAPDDDDPAHRDFGDPKTTLAYVVTLDAINFGSGWFPELHKPEGRSGYFTVAKALERRFDRDGPWSAAELTRLDAVACAELFGQRDNAAVAPLMELFARALRDLGQWLETRHRGRFDSAVEAACGSAERLAASLLEMPLYRDRAHHRGGEVHFYKRAQITAADLALAFRGEGPGSFDDLERLTIFADNLVPHVLRCRGVLVHSPELAERIERGERLEAGSEEEVEIRALALHAVERALRSLRERGVAASAQLLDQRLWNRGQLPEFKSQPRHRCCCPYY